MPQICDRWYLRVFLDPSVVVIFSLSSLGSFFLVPLFSFPFPFPFPLPSFAHRHLPHWSFLTEIARHSIQTLPFHVTQSHCICLCKTHCSKSGQNSKRGYRPMCTFSDTIQPRYNSWTTCPPFRSLHCYFIPFHLFLLLFALRDHWLWGNPPPFFVICSFEGPTHGAFTILFLRTPFLHILVTIARSIKSAMKSEGRSHYFVAYARLLTYSMKIQIHTGPF